MRCAGVLAIVVALAVLHGQSLELGPARAVARGVELYHSADPTLIDPAGVVSVWLLRVDLAQADIRAALANGEVMGTEAVADTAARGGAIAAINAGFFRPNGDPAGVFTIDGRLVSETDRSRGAVGIVRQGPATSLVFDRLTAAMSLVILRPRGRTARVPIPGIDTTRLLGKLMLFTPTYHAHTDTAPGGTEWTMEGAPPRIAGPPRRDGRTPIPPAGFVLSYGGPKPPAVLAGLKRGDRVRVDTHYAPAESTAEQWAAASDIVGGAGLLARHGRYVDDWTVEKFGPGFAEARHPRTMIGITGDAVVWLVTVDGRQPGLSSGMTLVELRELARRLRLTDALNLDGGGSTTMWVRGTIVNSPSDGAGPRKVSDSLLVVER
jgi:hypothetical protein